LGRIIILIKIIGVQTLTEKLLTQTTAFTVGYRAVVEAKRFIAPSVYAER